jgi:hypothetical protein
MQAWLESPYRSVGVYIGGVSRGCAQPNLTPEWVSAVLAQGWSLIPTYVGLQAPCSQYANRVDPATASAQGIQQADDAANAAAALGFRAGSPIYFDMEHFDTTAEGCTEAVLTFLESWTEQLHVRGFTSGVYSSASSGIAELANANAADPSYVEPDAIWFAWWNNVADTKGTKYFTDDMWTNHQRLHQYRGGGQETYGGVTINIDRDYLDGPVVGATSSEPVPPERHSRSVDLSLTEGRRRLLVDGRVRVSGGFASCVDRVPVKIQRRADGPWNTIARRTTTSAGRFDARLRLRRGRYRAVAPRTSSPTDICLTAASAALRFRPS